MKRLPQRQSLVSQTTDILREQIIAGEYSDSLPGERDLSARLRVSRPTVRSALEQIRREGLIQVSQGQRRKIQQNVSQKLPRKAEKRIGLLTPIPLHRMPPFVMFWIDELRERLAEEGFDLIIHITPASSISQPARFLARLMTDVPSTAWLLFRSGEPMQKWFADHALPAVVIGSRFSGVQLPSVDVDYQAACRHAVGVFLSKGHRKVAVLLPKPSAAGDRASEAGFVEGSRRVPEVQAVVATHDESVTGLCRRLDALLMSEVPVTAILVARSAHTLTALSYLQTRGVRLPKDLSLISRDDELFFDFVVPRVSRYGCPPAAFARQMSRIVLRLAKEQSLPPRQTLLMPQFIEGETVGHPPRMDSPATGKLK